MTILITVVGIVLCLASGALPQWEEEKMGVRRLTKAKDILLTQGNGAHEVIVIRCLPGTLNLEDLATPYRDMQSPLATQVLASAIAGLWVALLISIAGWELHTWFLLGIGLLGIVHNIFVAAVPRNPRAYGIDMEYVDTIVEEKTIGSLWRLEDHIPGAGIALVDIFFPGKLRDDEQEKWDYAARRRTQYNMEPRIGQVRLPAWGRSLPWDG